MDFAEHLTGATAPSFPHLRRWRFHKKLAFALLVQLVTVSAVGDFAQAQNPMIFSACRVPPRAAFGEIRLNTAESRKAYTFVLAATRFKFVGDYDHAIEQINQAVNVDPENPRLYLERGAAYAANREFKSAI